MNLCYILLVHSLDILIGEPSVVSGSLELTSSPATATDGELFTMMCTGSQGGSRAWSRNKVTPVVYTHQGSTKVQLVSPQVTRDLVGRFSVSSSENGAQHNITLKINARIDNGDAWGCVDEIHNERSNLLTIAAVTTSTTLTSKVSTQSTTSGSSVSTRAVPSDPVTTIPLAPTTTSAYTTVIYGTTTQISAALSPPPAVIAAVAAAAVIIIVIAVVVLFVWRNRRSDSRKDRQESGIYANPSAYEDMNSLYCELRPNCVPSEDETTPSNDVDTQDQTPPSIL